MCSERLTPSVGHRLLNTTHINNIREIISQETVLTIVTQGYELNDTN